MKKLILTLLAAGLAASAFAQEEQPVIPGEPVTTSGFFEGGFWQVLKNPGSAKFQEYRQVKEGLVLNRFNFDMAKGKYYFNTRVGEAGKTDQAGELSFGVTRKWKNLVSWSQVPHLLSTTSREFFVSGGPGVYTLPDSMQRQLQQSGGRIENFLQGARPFNLGGQRNTARATSEAHPLPDVTVKAGYTNERKRGTKAHGAIIGTPGSFRLMELPEDLDHETHNFFAGAEWAKKNYSADLEYRGQVFNNKVGALIWDNPFRVTSDSVTAPKFGRMSLYPDHTTHNFSASGSANLPYKTRSVATFSYGTATQDEAFLPHTINSAITDPSGGLALPAASLDGKFKTILFNYQITSRPVDKLSLKGRARYYELDNQTPELTFNSSVTGGDYQLQTLGRMNLAYGYIKRNFGAEAGWRLLREADVSFGYNRENISRNHREVQASAENIFNGTIDVRPTAWVTVRSSYTHAKRTADSAKYHPHYFEESFPEGEAVVDGGTPLDEFRRFDVYNRDRDKVELSSQFSPTDQVDVGVSFSLAQDQFANIKSGELGLEAVWNRGLGMDISYSPMPRLTLFGDIGREDSRAEMESRYRLVNTIANPDSTLDSSNNDWSGHLKDRFDNFGLGFSVEVWPKKLSWGANYGFSFSRSALTASFAPGGNASGDAASYPNIYYKFHSLGSKVSYKLTTQAALSFAYRYEKYIEDDWSLDILQPYMGNVVTNANRSVFLGATIPDYEVHVLSLQLSYAF